MDYINEFDIHLDKEMYYAGETLSGYVLLKTIENFKLKAIKAILRGKANCCWQMVIKNEKRTVKDEEIFIDDRSLIFGNEKSDQMIPILPRGKHVFNFTFSLPQSSLPCSFESRFCTIRYYVKVTLDIPYSSPPQGIKYFTIIGPHIDVMDQRYLKPLNANKQDKICCFCTTTYITQLKCQLERSAFCAGETIRVKAFVHNKSSSPVRLRIKLVQNFGCSIQRGVLGLSKQSSHVVLEYRGDEINVDSRSKFDSGNSLEIPTMPPTIDADVCRLMSISYTLKIWIESDKSNELLKVNFPIVIATSPFRIPNSANQPIIEYENCVDFIEGGNYISPEFQLGQVYDGGLNSHEEVVLFRPVYVSVKRPPKAEPLGSGKDSTKEPKDAHSKDAKELALHHQSKEAHLKDLHSKESKDSHSSSHLRESHSRYSSQNSSKELANKEDGLSQVAQASEIAATGSSSGSKRAMKQKKQSLKNQHSLDSAVLIDRQQAAAEHKRSGSIQQGQMSFNKLKLSSLDEQAINEFNLLENNNLPDGNLLDGSANQSVDRRRSSGVISSQPRSSSIGYQ